MNDNSLNIIIEDEQWDQALESIKDLSNHVFSQVIADIKQNEAIDFLELGKPLEINLSLSNDAEVQKLNAEFRHLDKPTNVLSFANIDDESFEETLADSPVIELGDIIIALETLQKEAILKNISLHNHYCHLLTHGLLHLLGFDHQDDEDAEAMENIEIQILQNMNINNPYEE